MSERLLSSTNRCLQPLSSTGTNPQHGWAARPSTHHGQRRGSGSRAPGHAGINGPGYLVFGNRRGPSSAVCSFLFQKIPSSVKDPVFEGSVALQSFPLLVLPHTLIKDAYGAAAGCLLGINDQVGNGAKLQNTSRVFKHIHFFLWFAVVSLNHRLLTFHPALPTQIALAVRNRLSAPRTSQGSSQP